TCCVGRRRFCAVYPKFRNCQFSDAQVGNVEVTWKREYAQAYGCNRLFLRSWENSMSFAGLPPRFGTFCDSFVPPRVPHLVIDTSVLSGVVAHVGGKGY
uniref:Uncharacterized protein n=1 Tax=Parascaris univalens TaxID=6257 RepID=A0A915B2W6_PARUN